MFITRPSALIYPILAILLSAAASINVVPQNAQTQTERPRKVFPKEQEPEDVLRFDTDLVSVDVTAMDAEGRPVKTLKPDDFKVYSDGVEQNVSFFHIEQRE